jgi:hypothetical protein
MCDLYWICHFLFSHKGCLPLHAVMYALSISQLMFLTYPFTTEQNNKMLGPLASVWWYLFKSLSPTHFPDVSVVFS